MESNELTEEELNQWEQEDLETDDALDEESEPNASLRVIKTNFDYNLDYLAQSIEKNIYLGPHYQRRSRWSNKQKSLLIESLLMNIPIPPIFLFERDYHEYEVVDGRQRLEAIKGFIDNKFRLRDLQYLRKLNGENFKSLDQDMRRQLIRRTISATVLMAESKGLDEIDIRMVLFDRLNTGGVKLNSQELRNAVHSGLFNEALIELAEDEKFREIWGIPHPKGTDKELEKTKKKLVNNKLYKSMMDVELVLRFFAIIDAFDEAKARTGSMKKLLDLTMKEKSRSSEEEIQALKESFLESINGLYELFGAEAFKNPLLEKGGKARNLYDSLMVAYSSINEDDLESTDIVESNLRKVLEDKGNYEKIISKGNSIDNIKFRVAIAKKVLTTNLS